MQKQKSLYGFIGLSFLIMLVLTGYAYATPQPYNDSIDIINATAHPVMIKFRIKDQWRDSTYNYWRVHGDGYAAILHPSILNEVSSFILLPSKSVFFYFTSYGFKTYYELSVYEKFIMVAGEFEVRTEKGDVLMTLDDLVPEDFILKTHDNGITEAYIILQDKHNEAVDPLPPPRG